MHVDINALSGPLRYVFERLTCLQVNKLFMEFELTRFDSMTRKCDKDFRKVFTSISQVG